MDEKALLDWKEANAEVYSKFKEDLEEQLLKPYHQNFMVFFSIKTQKKMIITQ